MSKIEKSSMNVYADLGIAEEWPRILQKDYTNSTCSCLSNTLATFSSVLIVGLHLAGFSSR